MKHIRYRNRIPLLPHLPDNAELISVKYILDLLILFICKVRLYLRKICRALPLRISEMPQAQCSVYIHPHILADQISQ